jgi:TPR repeat protein
MDTNQGTKVVKPVEPVFHDQVKNLAEKGDAEAEMKMGLRYTSIARGVKNDRIAVQWFEKAAQQDQVEAQYRYGLALLNGQGIVQDYKTAFYWLEKAAQQGHAQAQSTLGEMYHAGLAVNKDIERAYLWFNLAAAQGVESAVAARDIVVKLLTPSQIIALQQEAGRISRGYRSSSVADASKTVINESDPVDVDSVPADEPMPVVAKQTVKSVIRILKDWWKDNLQ